MRTRDAFAIATSNAPLAIGVAALALLASSGGGRAAPTACLRPPLLGRTLAAATHRSAFFSSVAGTVVAPGTAPVATGPCGAPAFHERLTRRWGAATALAVVGCVVLAAAGSSGAAAAHPAGTSPAVLRPGQPPPVTTVLDPVERPEAALA